MYDFALLVLGLAIVVKGADLLVGGAACMASRLGIPSMVIGLTVVSFGTSMPEMIVTLVSGLRGNPDLAIGNVIGSNIANVLLILGVAAIIRPLPVTDSTVFSEIPFSLTAALLVGFLANAALFSTRIELTISHLDGAILLFFFFLFMLYVYRVSRKKREAAGPELPERTMLRSSVYVVLGVAALYFGGRWVVDGAVGIATTLGVDDAVIGLTIVAIGTSTPELVASAVAAWRGQTDIAVGNVVGSNIFNLLWVLGLTSTIVELPFEMVSNTDLLMVIAASTMVLLAMVVSRRNAVMRWHGVVFVVSYLIYLAFVVQRG